MVAGEFRADLVVETQARLLVVMLHGLMVQWHRQPGSVDWRTVAEEIVRGLCAPSADERPAETFVNEQKCSRGMREV